ncbi:MAG: transcriptional regulator [Myxococcaceae bacterium]|nr:transcriptional regulator [Myxococcaceae bacterium]
MIYTFGDFELDEARFELRRLGQVVAAQPKVLRLLLLLVAERQRSVSDQELTRALWPGETVGPASIKRAVMGARIALDDRGQGCIRTIRGYGYQFMLPVQARSASSLPPAPAFDAPIARAASPMVGRDGVFRELDDSLERMLAGHGQCVLILGEPGMGKTSILTELCERAAKRGARVSLGRCLEMDGAPPFWPVQQILRSIIEGLRLGELDAPLGPIASDIAEGFPELKESLCDPPAAPEIGSIAARFRLFDSVARFLLEASRTAPIVVLLDDLHKADQPTLRLLSFLLGQLDRARLLLVGTARHAELRDREAHARLTEIARESATKTIALTGLTRAEIAHYLVQQTGAPVSAAALQNVFEQTAGNPLFLEEIVRNLRTREELTVARALERSTEVRQSRGLRGAIDRHLATLSPRTCELLAHASIIGRDFSLGLLTQLVESSPRDVLLHLSRATAAGVLHELPGSVGHYRFTHALLRDALYDQSDGLQRARQHARIGLFLEARNAAVADDAQLASMAEHFRLAAHLEAADKALFYACRVAERAMQRLAYEDAAEHYRRALELAELGALDQEQCMQLLLARGEALAYGAEPTKARAPLLQAVTLARALGKTDVVARAARLLGGARESGTVDKEYVGLLREALAALPDSDSRTPCLRALLAKALSFSKLHTERAELAMSALSLTHGLVCPMLRAEALHACHEALTAPEHLAQRSSIAQQLSKLAHQHADPRTRLYAITAHFQNCIERGQVGELEAVITELETLERQVRNPVMRWYAATYRSTCAMIAGQLEVAEARAQEALLLGNALGEELAHHQFCAQVTGVYRLQGRIREAEAITRDVCARFPALAGWRSVFGSIQADLERTDAARRIFAELMDGDLVTLRADPYLLSALCPMADLCVRVGDVASAKTLYDALLPHEHLHGNVSYGVATHGPVSLHLARLATRSGELSAAEQHGTRALEAAERMPSVTFTALACLTQSYILKEIGGRDARARSIALVERAHCIADATGMRAVSSRCLGMSRLLVAG